MKTYETVVQGRRKVIQVQPDIERADWWDINFQPQLLESLKDMIAFRLEVLLESQLHSTAR